MMHGSMSVRATSYAKAFWCAVLCAATVSFTSAAYADGRGREEKRRGEHRSWTHDHDARPRHGRDHDDWRRSGRTGWDDRYASDWRYGYDRYDRHAREWPSLQRHGRRCADRRHYHRVHYHVLARDYYDYYYPRYRYYGAAPVGAHASVIITLPLF